MEHDDGRPDGAGQEHDEERTVERSAADGRMLDALASQLVWRIGRTADEAPLTVRVGFVSSAALFGELPRLRNASDAEIQDALDAGELRVEWVGPRSR